MNISLVADSFIVCTPYGTAPIKFAMVNQLFRVDLVALNVNFATAIPPLYQVMYTFIEIRTRYIV
jgi:hypothetical protein